MKYFQDLLSDRHAREDLKNKVEVIMAVVTLAGFVYKRYKGHADPTYNITSLEG